MVLPTLVTNGYGVARQMRARLSELGGYDVRHGSPGTTVIRMFDVPLALIISNGFSRSGDCVRREVHVLTA